jgi:hypothetical protein
MIPRAAAAVSAVLLFGTLFPAAAGAATAADVLVVGGTPAGVAAAVAAARHGENVTLVVQRSQLGGVLTDAMMDQWDLNLAPDGSTIEGGIFREMYAALGDAFTPADAARVFAALVAAEPRIHTMFGARPIAVRTADFDADRQIEDVTFARPGHRVFTVAADAVIDATDDADVAALAGARYDLGRQDTGIDELMQPVTLMFTVSGVDWHALARGYDERVDGPGGAMKRRVWGYGRVLADYWPVSPEVLVRDLNFGRESDGTLTVNAIDVMEIDGRFPSELDRARAITEREAPRLIAFLRSRLPGFAGARIAGYADAVYVRETRHVVGLRWLSADDVWNGVLPADRIGLSSYPLDLHPVTPTEPLAFAPVRHVYGVPFGALVPQGIGNLLVASPAISASHEAAGSARVVPTTIEEGEAAGTAAALADQQHVTFATMAQSAAGIAGLQSDLRRGGAILDYAAPPVTVASAGRRPA